MKKLKKEFFQRSALIVAREILGKYLIREFPYGKVILKIVEAEAYMGVDDPASHSYGGKITERNKVMYEDGGLYYVYKIYGMHYCLNVVANKKGIPEAVFIRAGEPIQGLEIIKENRGLKGNFKVNQLTNGPSKITQALKIDLSFYGKSVEDSQLYFLEGEKIKEADVVRAPRVNIDYAGEAKFYPWRFYIRGNEYVSCR